MLQDIGFMYFEISYILINQTRTEVENLTCAVNIFH